jgi:hypothetical protein
MNKKRHWLILVSMSFAAAGLWAAEPTATPPAQPTVKPAPAAETGKPGEAPTVAAKAEAAAKADPAKPDAKPDAAKTDPVKPDPAKPGAAQAAAKPGEKPAVDDKSSPQRFIPSEQVRADFDVSFPIDI